MSRESLACVRFGLITEDTDLEELIALVYTTGREVEESSKVSTQHPSGSLGQNVGKNLILGFIYSYITHIWFIYLELNHLF